MQMELQNYFASKKELYQLILDFLDCSEDDEGNSYSNLYSHIQKEKLIENKIELRSFIRLIMIISNNHHREQNFYKKIEKIFLSIKDSIKQTNSISEIFDLFYSNKRILLFAFQQNFLPINDTTFSLLLNKNKKIEKNQIKHGTIELYSMIEQLQIKQSKQNYLYYFYPEFQSFFSREQREEIQENLREFTIENSEEFNEKREKGENDSNICSLIRNDSIIEFITLINQINYPLTSQIESSIFETNEFLFDKNPTLIEYAAFYGSFQIFQYLQFNDVKLSSSLWLYAIHGKNADIIHLLEDNHILPIENMYFNCYKESIKCHHNDIANYIECNLLNSQNLVNKNKYSFRFYNYQLINDNIDDYNMILTLACDYNYCTIVEILLKKNEIIIIDDNEILLLFKNAANNNNVDIVNLLMKLKNFDINEKFFSNLYKMSYCAIPESTKKIKKSLFLNCLSLFEVTIPSSVTKIEDNAFKNCISLKNITIPQSVTEIGKNAFECCESLTKIEIPSSVTELKSKTFAHCSSLKDILIPSIIKQIGSYCFVGCLSLNEFHIPSSVTDIKDYTFSCCSSLTEIVIAPKVKNIGMFAFAGCSSLTRIIIPSSVESIGTRAFFDCSSLKEICIPSSVTSTGYDLLFKCSSLMKISVPSCMKLRNIGITSDDEVEITRI